MIKYAKTGCQEQMSLKKKKSLSKCVIESRKRSSVTVLHFRESLAVEKNSIIASAISDDPK